jgi:hypothetical protein
MLEKLGAHLSRSASQSTGPSDPVEPTTALFALLCANLIICRNHMIGTFDHHDVAARSGNLLH